MCTIVEQLLEWKRSLWINFINHEKAFDSLDRNVLWELMANYGIPGNIISVVKNMYRVQTTVFFIREAYVSNQV